MLTTVPAPSMTLLFGSFERLQAAIAGGQRRFGRFAIGRVPDGEVVPQAEAEEDGTPLAFKGPSGVIITLGIKARAPGLDGMIQSTRIDDAELASLQDHGAHMLCFQRGEGDGYTLSLELFELAAALAEFDLLGAIHTPGSQCFRRDQIAALVGMDKAERDEGALDKLLVNRIPLFGEGCTYFVTRGAQVLGTPEICLFDAANALAPPQVNSVIYNLLPYIRGGARFEVGQTAEFDGIQMTVEEVDATYADYIRALPEDEVIQLRVGGSGAGGGGGGERRLAVAGIVAAAVLVAAADGSIDRKELNAAVDHLLAKSGLADIGPYFQEAVANFQQLADRILSQEPQKIVGLLVIAAGEVEELHGPEVALAYGRALYGMAKGIAEASGGGLFGLGAKIGKEERAVLEAMAEALGLNRV